MEARWDSLLLGFPQSFLFWETNAFVGYNHTFPGSEGDFGNKEKPAVIFLLIAVSLTLILSLATTHLSGILYSTMFQVSVISDFGAYLRFSYGCFSCRNRPIDTKNSTDPKVNRNYLTVAVIGGVTAFGLILSGRRIQNLEYFQHETVLKTQLTRRVLPSCQ